MVVCPRFSVLLSCVSRADPPSKVKVKGKVIPVLFN
jgi:hypothetical protein